MNAMNNKIISRFYVITLNKKPVYVGYTNRPIEQRFNEHKRDKDFGKIQPEIEQIAQLEYEFTWDTNKIDQYANEVNDKECELIKQYHTQNSKYQKANGGGQNWANIKYFVNTNHNNPKFFNMPESDILKRIENEHNINKYLMGFQKVNTDASIYMKHFIQNIYNPPTQYMMSFITNMNNPATLYIHDYIHSMNDPTSQYMQSFIKNMHNPVMLYITNYINSIQEPSYQYMSSFITNIHNPPTQYMMSFITHMKNPTIRYLTDYVNGIKEPIYQYMKSFTKNMNNPPTQYMISFISNMNNPATRYINDCINDMKEPTSQYLKLFVTNMH